MDTVTLRRLLLAGTAAGLIAAAPAAAQAPTAQPPAAPAPAAAAPDAGAPANPAINSPDAAPADALAGTEGEASDIIVTAQKRAERLIDVPIAIQAFQGEALEQSGTNTLTQLVDFIPGASVVSQSAAGFETIQIRGVSSGTVGDATVGYYVDDVAFSIPNLQLAPPSRLFDLTRTEVLRGPQGTLYGSGAMGGLIRILTGTPDTRDWEVRARTEFSGTDGGGFNYALDGLANVPIAADKAGLRITGGYEHLSGFAGTPTDPDAKANYSNSTSLRGKLLLTPTETLSIALSIWYIDNYSAYGNNLLTLDPPTLPEAFGTDPFVSAKMTLYSGLINWELGGVTLQSATSWVDHELALDVTANLTGLGIRAVDDFDTGSFNQEVRLVSNTDGPFQWILGGIYTDATINSFIDVTVVIPTVPPLSIPFQKTFDAPLTSKSFAFYGEASYDLMDGKLVPLIGLRYYNDKRTASGTTIFGGTTFVDNASAKFDALSPRFNLTYKPSDDAIIYGNISQGFRSGTIQTRGQVILAGLDGVTTDIIIQPDKLWTYELGTKWKFPTTGLQFELAGYYTDWSNIQIPFTTTGGLVAVVNGGDARIYGVDFGISWATPLTGLSLQAVANVNSSEFTDVDPQLAATLPTAQNGEQLPGVPKANFTLAATYRTPINDSWDLTLYSSYAWRGDQTDLASGIASAQLNQLQFRAAIENKWLRGELFVTNALNDLGPQVVTSTAVQPLYPRTFGLSLAVKY